MANSGKGGGGRRVNAAGAMVQQRRKSRHYGVQAIYRWQLNGGSTAEIEAEFRTEYDLGKADLDYFRAILEGVIYHQPDIDAAFANYLDRDIAALTPVELALLRQAVFELKERLDVPYKVVISEAVALATKFGATDSYKYINGVLDRVAAKLRAAEVAAN
jgi:N utilization substance protein B